MTRLPTIVTLAWSAACLTGLVACATALTPAQVATGQTVATVAGATVPYASQIIADGALVCQGESLLATIVDGTTGKPYLVTGKAAQTVANVCALLGAVPVPQPAGSAPLPVAVAIPGALKA